MKKNFNIKGIAYWFLIIFALLLLLMLLIGQTGGLINYQMAVRLGLQESTDVITQFGVAMNRGFAAADTIIYVPLVVFAILGFLCKKRWGLICMAGVMGITAYWPLVCLLTLIFAHGTPGFSFDSYLAYSVVLGTISLLGVWGLAFLSVKSKEKTSLTEKDAVL